MQPTSPPPRDRVSWPDWPFWPYVLVGLTVLLRLIHIWNSRHNPTFLAPAIDPAWYDQTAQNILAGSWGPFPLFRAPVYPTLLAAVYGLFGHDLFAARVLNALLQGGTVWAIWQVGRSYFSPRVGLAAALLFALNGMAIYFAAELVPPSAEMLVGMLAVWSLLRLSRDGGPSALFICGFAWGVAAITRPNFLTLFPLVALGILFLTHHPKLTLPRARSLPRAARALVIWVAAAAIPILPVTAANWLKGQEFVLIASQGGVNFWIGNNPQASGAISVLPGYGNTWTMEDAAAEASKELGHMPGPGELSRHYYAKGWNFLKVEPVQATRFMIRKTLLFFNHFEISNNKHIAYFSALSPWLPALLWLNFGVLVPFGLLGAWVLWRLPQTKVLVGLILLYMASVVLFFMAARFRMPTVPWFCLLAAGGGVWLFEMVRARAKARQFAPLLLLAPGCVLAFMNPWQISEAPVGWARFMEGNAYLKLNQLDSARVAFLDATRYGEDSGLARLNLGVIASRLGRNTEARQWFESALRDDSGNADAWNNLGTVYESLGDTARAISAYERALRLKPAAADPRHNLAGVHFHLGVAYLKAGADSLAIVHLERCLGLLETPAVHFDLAIALERQGRLERALAHVDAALRMDPRMSSALQFKERLGEELKAAPPGGAPPPDRD